MGKLIDMTGQKFGRLLVLEQLPAVKRRAMWLCRCDCGKEVPVRAVSLRRGKTRSCGCLRRDEMRRKATTIDGKCGEKLHGVWNMMKQRCLNRNCKDFKYYGLRGIRVCDEWIKDYLTFRAWALSNGYEEGLTIDRIDPDGNYEPSNCRWITIQAQQKNRRPKAVSEED